VTSGGRLAGIDVADNDEVDVNLLLAHCVCAVKGGEKNKTNQSLRNEWSG
jgi:hypothetical protein